MKFIVAIAYMALIFVLLIHFFIFLARLNNLAINFILFYELAIYFHAAIIAFAGPLAMVANRHIRLGNRNKKFEIVGFVIFAMPFLLAIFIYGIAYAWNSIKIFEGSAELSGMPGLFIVKSLIAIFAVLMILASFYILRQKK